MQYVTARQAADMTGQSERTIRRMIKAGKLKARHVAPNRYEIAVEDLPRKKRDPLGELRAQVEALERRVRTLEALNAHQTRYDAILSEQVSEAMPAPQSRPTAFSVRQTSVSNSTLPPGLVSVDSFAHRHGMRESQRTTWSKAITTGRLPAQINAAGWKHDRTYVKHALDAEGRRVFWELWHAAPWFVVCEECPHE